MNHHFMQHPLMPHPIRVACYDHWAFQQLPGGRTWAELAPDLEKIPDLKFAEATSTTAAFLNWWVRTDASSFGGAVESWFGWHVLLRPDGNRMEMEIIVLSSAAIQSPGCEFRTPCGPEACLYADDDWERWVAPPSEEERLVAKEDLTQFLPTLFHLLQIDSTSLQRLQQPL
jgi:hypothetical protein